MAENGKGKPTESELAKLFELSRDAVVGVRGVSVVFMNPSARDLFGPLAEEAGAQELLPGYLLQSELDSFVSLAELRGVRRQVTGVRKNGLLLLTIPRDDQPMAAIPGALLNQLRTEASNLRLAADLILQRTQADEKLPEYAGAMYHSYYSILRLTDALADASAISGGRLVFRPRSADLSGLCRALAESADFFVATTGAHVLWQGDDAPCPALLDRGRIEQMLLGLFSGALQRGAKTIRLGLRKRGGLLVVSVDDDGAAIPKDKLSHAFSLWSRQDVADVPDGGEELCFFIAQGIADLHGGAMLLQSQPKKGTQVRISLPGSSRYVLRDCAHSPHSSLLLKMLSPVLDRSVYQKRYMD